MNSAQNSVFGIKRKTTVYLCPHLCWLKFNSALALRLMPGKDNESCYSTLLLSLHSEALELFCKK